MQLGVLQWHCLITGDCLWCQTSAALKDLLLRLMCVCLCCLLRPTHCQLIEDAKGKLSEQLLKYPNGIRWKKLRGDWWFNLLGDYFYDKVSNTQQPSCSSNSNSSNHSTEAL